MTTTPSATSKSAPETEEQVYRPKGRRFARRSYPARVLGLGLGFIAVAAVFWSQSRSWPLWALLTAYAFAWPHIAYLYASRVSDSYRTGQHQLMFDAVCGGLWAAAMSFNLLPSALILTMLSMNNMAAGGMMLFLKGTFAQLIGLFGGVIIFGWHPHWDTSLVQIMACIPFLVVHPLAVGAMTYGFAQRLHAQKTA
jgi:diguanylate cyclase